MDDREKQDKVFENASSLRKQHKERKPGNRRWIMLVVLVVLVGVAVGGIYLAQNIKPAAKVQATLPPSTAFKLVEKEKADFVEATVQLDKDSYTVMAKGDGYALKDAPQFALDQTKANDLVSTCVYMYADTVEENAKDLAVYGLDQPASTVRIVYQDGTNRTFLLGDQAPTGQRYYLMEQGNSTVYTVYSSTGTRFITPRQAMHVVNMPAVTVDTIKNVSLTHQNGTTVTIGYQENMETLGISALWLTEPVMYEADGEKANAYFESIAGIQCTGFAVDALPETLGMYGLDNPRYHLTVNGTVADASGNVTNGKLLELFIGNDKDETSTYARIDDTNDVYVLNRSTVAFLADITTAKLIDRFANIINIAKVDAIDVITESLNDHFTITRTPELDENGNQKTNSNGQPVNIEDFTLNGETMEDATFRKIYQVFIGTRVDGIIPDGKAPAEDVKPILTVRYTLNTLRDTETIEYIPYDADHYAVRRSGVCMFYILKSRVDNLPRALEAYHAGTFVPADFGV